MDLTPPNINNLDDVKVYLERMYEFIKWWGNLQVQYMEWQEVTAPEAPESGRFRIVATQSSDGRTQFIAKFNSGDVLVAIEEFTTDDLTEGTTNQFFTTGLSGVDTDNLSEGSTNLYYTDTRVSAQISEDLPDTDSLSEGSTNLYYTDTRADARVDAGFTSRQQTYEADLSTTTITDPADSPATADALRDDLVANALNEIETSLNNLESKVNSIITKLEGTDLFADS